MILFEISEYKQWHSHLITLLICLEDKKAII